MDDGEQRERLCKCMNMLGGKPCVGGSTVNVMFEYSSLKSAEYLEAIENYIRSVRSEVQ